MSQSVETDGPVGLRDMPWRPRAGGLPRTGTVTAAAPAGPAVRVTPRRLLELEGAVAPGRTRGGYASDYYYEDDFWDPTRRRLIPGPPASELEFELVSSVT